MKGYCILAFPRVYEGLCRVHGAGRVAGHRKYISACGKVYEGGASVHATLVSRQPCCVCARLETHNKSRSLERHRTKASKSFSYLMRVTRPFFSSGLTSVGTLIKSAQVPGAPLVCLCFWCDYGRYLSMLTHNTSVCVGYMSVKYCSLLSRPKVHTSTSRAAMRSGHIHPPRTYQPYYPSL